MTNRVMTAAILTISATVLAGCGSSPEEQIIQSIQSTVETGIEHGDVQIQQMTGGGVAHVELDDFELGDRRVRAETTYDSGETTEELVRVEEQDGRWQVSR